MDLHSLYVSCLSGEPWGRRGQQSRERERRGGLSRDPHQALPGETFRPRGRWRRGVCVVCCDFCVTYFFRVGGAKHVVVVLSFFRVGGGVTILTNAEPNTNFWLHAHLARVLSSLFCWRSPLASTPAVTPSLSRLPHPRAPARHGVMRRLMTPRAGTVTPRCVYTIGWHVVSSCRTVNSYHCLGVKSSAAEMPEIC